MEWLTLQGYNPLNNRYAKMANFMELKATSFGKHLAQHPYNRVRLLTAGVEVSGKKHEYIIPFNELLGIQCKRGLVWGELEFELLADKVVRLHGTEWEETRHFYHNLLLSWQAWSQEMSEISASVLKEQVSYLQLRSQQDKWMTRHELAKINEKIHGALQMLPFPASRLNEFENCRELYRICQSWLTQAEDNRATHNSIWSERILEQHRDFFDSVESSPLNKSQASAVINGEDNVLVLAGAGSGKTSVLVARAGWLLRRKLATTDQILLLAFGRKAAEEMNERIHQRLQTQDIQAKTFHALALHIIREGSHKAPMISQLEGDSKQRHQLLISCWQKCCSEKKSYANGWRQWLRDELAWEIDDDDDYWQNEKLTQRLASRLDRWLSLMRMHGGSVSAMIESVPEQIREAFSKRVKLMSPLLKEWKNRLKQEGATDFSGLIHQAINILEKKRFISPWKHILVDEFQDISPQRARLLSALCHQNRQTSLFVTGDDWQAIYRFSGAEMGLTTAFHHHFGEGDFCMLDTTYRFNARIGDIASRFIQQNPFQLKKTLNSLTQGNKKSIALLSESKLDALLNKISGYAGQNEKVLLLARYHYLRPDAILDKAKIRWPGLAMDFMTIHASKGQQADYVIVLGLREGPDGFPAICRESIIEKGLLPEPEPFPDPEESRLAYVAMTRAKQQVWLLFDQQQPSRFVSQLKQLNVAVLRNP